MSETTKKPFYKKWPFWVIIVLFIGIGSQARKKADQEASNTAASAPTPVATVAAEGTPDPTPPANDPHITMGEFNRIQDGMTRAEVEQIVGGSGEVTMQAGSGEYAILGLSFKGEGIMETASVTFTGGKVSGKMQLGLGN